MIKSKSVYISLDDIKVPQRFEKKLPSADKIAARVKVYRKLGCFDRELIIDEDNNLIDGYTVYLVCKMLGIEKIRALRLKANDSGANLYQQAALRTAGTDNFTELLLNGVMGLSGESGECIDMVKKMLFQGHELDHHELAKELGDVAWYLAVTAHAIGYDLETVLEMNIEKLRNRYPDGFDADRSLHREEGDT